MVRLVFAALFLAGLLPSTLQAQPWQAEGWSHRALVTIEARGDRDVDVAGVRLLHAGLAQPDGDDFRVFDASGQPLPYELVYHHPQRDSLISFRCDDAAGRYAIYFGKADAPRDPLRAAAGAPSDTGPPQPGPDAQGWVPRAGLVLATMRRPPEVDNPKTVEEMAALITQSPQFGGHDGADYVTAISHGLNPFGDSDHYISVYRGWIRLPNTGRYGFCTASNEASFSFLGGRELVHWPGRHTEQRGKYGEKAQEHDLEAGLHHVTYLHEEVLLYQVAFLGWKPPGAGHYVAIPGAQFPQPHRAAVQRYETAAGVRTVMPRVELLDSLWPRERPSGQYTRYRFVADGGAEALDLGQWSIQWGIKAADAAGAAIAVGTGPALEYVFLTTGTFQVEMPASPPEGPTVQRSVPAVVFPIEHLEPPFKAGDPVDYLPIVSRYDPAHLPGGAAIRELAAFHAEFGDDATAQQLAGQALERTDLDDAARLQMHLLAAGEAGTSRTLLASASDADTSSAEQAIAHLQAAHDLAAQPAERMRIAARLIRARGIALADVAAAESLYAAAEQTAQGLLLDPKSQAAFRDATIAIGDVHLLAGQHEQANQDYRTAEALAATVVPVQVRTARVGSMPETLRQQLEAQRYDEAMQTLEQWRDAFPADQVRGTLFFWAGKLHHLQQRHAQALRPLRLAVELGRGSEFEPEARWLLAETYRHLGDDAAQRAALQGLIASGLAGEFRDRALDAIKQ